MSAKYLPYFSKFYGNSTIRELATTGNSDFIKRTISASGYGKNFGKKTNYLSMFEKVYNLLLEHYRGEYVYKNAISESLLLARHSIDTSALISEFRAGGCKADVVILNGTSHAYEIKTEMDGLDRLDNQIKEYRKVFEYINVVTYRKNAEKLVSKLEDDIGIFALVDGDCVETVRDATSNIGNVKQDVIFDSLRKPEYCHIIKEEFGEIPDVPNTKLHKEAKSLFCQLPPEAAHKHMVEALKNRVPKKGLADFIKALPHSLKLAGLTAGLNEEQKQDFQALLHKRI